MAPRHHQTQQGRPLALYDNPHLSLFEYVQETEPIKNESDTKDKNISRQVSSAPLYVQAECVNFVGMCEFRIPSHELKNGSSDTAYNRVYQTWPSTLTPHFRSMNMPTAFGNIIVHGPRSACVTCVGARTPSAFLMSFYMGMINLKKYNVVRRPVLRDICPVQFVMTGYFDRPLSHINKHRFVHDWNYDTEFFSGGVKRMGEYKTTTTMFTNGKFNTTGMKPSSNPEKILHTVVTDTLPFLKDSFVKVVPRHERFGKKKRRRLTTDQPPASHSFS